MVKNESGEYDVYETQTLSGDEIVSTPDSPLYDNSKFVGWSLDKKEIIANIETTVTSDLTYFAVFTCSNLYYHDYPISFYYCYGDRLFIVDECRDLYELDFESSKFIESDFFDSVNGSSIYSNKFFDFYFNDLYCVWKDSDIWFFNTETNSFEILFSTYRLLSYFSEILSNDRNSCVRIFVFDDYICFFPSSCNYGFFNINDNTLRLVQGMGDAVWFFNDTFYYSNGSYQMMFDFDTFSFVDIEVDWGISDFTAKNLFVVNSNYFYVSDSVTYILDKSTLKFVISDSVLGSQSPYYHIVGDSKLYLFSSYYCDLISYF